MKTDRHLEALTESQSLLYSTKRTNVDHIIVSLDLLAKAYSKKCDPTNEMRCLSTIIQLNHSFLPDLWIRIGKSYHCLYEKMNKDILENISETFLQFSLKPNLVICCCYIRALVLLTTVERTVMSFAYKANDTAQNYLKVEIEKISTKNKVSQEVLDHIKFEMTKDIFNRYNASNFTTQGK